MSRVDLLVLSKLDTFESIGLFSVGTRFSDGLGLIGAALVAPALTVLVGAWPDDLDHFRDRVRHNVRLMLLVAGLSVVGFWAVAEPLLAVLYGERFAEAAHAARLLVLGAAMGILTVLGLNVLMAMGRHRVYPVVGLAGLVLTVVLNLVLVPIASYEGAALAGLLGDAIICLAIWAVVVGGPVRGLVPWTAVCCTTGVVALCLVLDVLLDDRVPWPFVTVGSVLLVLVTGWLLRLPGLDHRALQRWRSRTGRGGDR
jgi:O-antigen/teichoic acid export membrane protein